MLGTELKSTDHHPYLGVELASSMDWKHHIQNVSGKAQRTLNFLQRNLYKCPQKVRTQAYTSLIRPTLEYAATIWDPYHQRDINSLERVQRKAVRFITGNYRRRSSVTALRADLGFPTLQQRRLASRLTLFYKIHNQEVSVQIPCHYIPQDTPSIKTRRTHEEQYKIIRARTEVYKNSYFPATIPVWNKLPASIVTSTSSQTFKTKIQQLVSSDQSELYMGSVVPAAASLN
ncbi:uncharacterized protein [Amphiura filiformis]|uniref:uncharacterized protein n=1 Tax=Amphiura filiformis TaxID=82378 RepID=UPI003B20E5DA